MENSYCRLVDSVGGGGFRTRVAAGSRDEVKSLYLKANSVFPMVSEERTGACFEDLEVFIKHSDTRRHELQNTDSEDIQLWTAKKAELETKVRHADDGIAESEGKIRECNQLIANEEIKINVYKDAKEAASKQIDKIKLGIRDVAPGLEVLEGIQKHSHVLFSAPRQDSIADVTKTYHVKSKDELKAKIGSDRVLATNCARSLFTCGANLHHSHRQVIKTTFAEIGQMGQKSVVDLCGELLGFDSQDCRCPRGLLAGRVSQRRSLSNERKRKAQANEDEDADTKKMRI